MKTLRVAALAAAFGLVAHGAFAVPNGTIGFAPTLAGGVTAYMPSGSELWQATSITISNNAGDNAINADPSTYLGSPNDFYPASTFGGDLNVFIGSDPTFTLMANGSALPVITFAGGADIFTATSEIVARNASTNSITFYFAGLYTGTVGSVGTDTAASLSFAFTQTGGATGSTNFSATLATPPAPPPPPVPEPMTLALLATGLAGLGAARRFI